MVNQLNNRPAVLFALAGTLLAASAGLISCSKSSEGTAVTPSQSASNPITGTSLTGKLRGTMLTGTAYTITGDVTVGPKDTLFVQKGVTVNVANNATFYVQGTLISEGTQASPITFTAPSGKPGSWGGFQCDSAKYVRIQWTHLDYTGGPDPTGNARKTLYVNVPIQVIVQDSWVKGGQDDGFRLQNGCMIDIQRNTIEGQGSTDGEAINVKGGATGVVAYNVVWATAGSAIKVETSITQLFPQTNVNVYNNTVVSNGFRRGAAEPGRGVLFDNFGRGNIYNNLIVNDYEGLDISPAADTANIKYGNNYFYATIDSLRTFYYPAGSKGKKQATDIISTSTTNKNPVFVKLDTNPNSATDTNDLHLQAGSPALGAGNPTYNKDIGAYTSDANGNKH
jgi:hypothetical protein